jgi:hypothetical protein
LQQAWQDYIISSPAVEEEKQNTTMENNDVTSTLAEASEDGGERSKRAPTPVIERGVDAPTTVEETATAAPVPPPPFAGPTDRVPPTAPRGSMHFEGSAERIQQGKEGATIEYIHLVSLRSMLSFRFAILSPIHTDYGSLLCCLDPYYNSPIYEMRIKNNCKTLNLWFVSMLPFWDLPLPIKLNGEIG